MFCINDAMKFLSLDSVLAAASNFSYIDVMYLSVLNATEQSAEQAQITKIPAKKVSVQ